MNILIIEDSKAEARILAQTLERIMDEKPCVEYKVTLGEARDRLNDEKAAFDLIFLDLKLSDSPEWDRTYEALAPYAKKVPVIVMSANDDREIAREVISKGAEDYIVKGSRRRNIDLLKETIDFALCRHRATRKLVDAVERDAHCIHWLSGGYSVESAS